MKSFLFRLRSGLLLATALILSGCGQGIIPVDPPSLAKSARLVRGEAATPEEQAALYLHQAATAAQEMGAGDVPTPARDTYNKAVADLAVLLRSADGGRLWNRPLTATAGGRTYRLRFMPGNPQGVWSPDEFTALVLAQSVSAKIIKRENHREGVGGTLVGVRKEDPRAPFAPWVGITAPVTATLDFKGTDAVLALHDPGELAQARVNGATRTLAADFSAPLAYYPSPNEKITGLMAAMRGSDYMATTGLYQLQPYNPDRIPLIFVHGLISTARMWRNVINEIESDPALRGRYQCWVFNYPTGNPVAYSALRFREELKKAEKIHGFPKGFVLVGHSMGGIVSRMQAVTLDRPAWERAAPGMIEKLTAGSGEDDLIKRALIFEANPHLKRAVFICTPHRGSEMAISSIGELGMRLIALPVTITSGISESVITSLGAFTGGAAKMPNSVTSLSPKNPTLKVIDQAPFRAPHHSIIGDRGRGDTPDSSDGVVPYWSSHLSTAKSEKIVPGPHGSCELPETIAELKRILHLHLKSGASGG
ncbi:MAG: esterase/lipase family protein [Luteolibacter sp.]